MASRQRREPIGDEERAEEEAGFQPLFLSYNQIVKVYADNGGTMLEANTLEARLREKFGLGEPLPPEGERLLATAPFDYERFRADFEATVAGYLIRVD